MKYQEAQAELKRVLKEQKTISAPKLNRIIQSLNISLKQDSPNQFLKRELQIRDEELKTLRQRVNNQRNEIKKLINRLENEQ
jgi:hypothetical protein